MNMTVTPITLTNPIIGDADFEDDVLTFTGAATYKAGTILARDSATEKLIAYVKGGSTNGNGIPKTVLTHDVVATGAGDVYIRAPLKAKVDLSKISILADGDNSNIDKPVIDQLRDFGIVAVSSSQLNIQDNQ